MPNWLYGLAALCYFFYRMLDEMDGKQARRTGNSSPLGMLFDHGIDAYTVGVQCLIFAKLSQFGNLGQLFLVGANMNFYFCTLQEYYQGGLFLPLGNAITDGSVGYILMMLVPAILGGDFWVTIVFPAGDLWEG